MSVDLIALVVQHEHRRFGSESAPAANLIQLARLFSCDRNRSPTRIGKRNLQGREQGHNVEVGDVGRQLHVDRELLPPIEA